MSKLWALKSQNESRNRPLIFPPGSLIANGRSSEAHCIVWYISVLTVCFDWTYHLFFLQMQMVNPCKST